MPSSSLKIKPPRPPPSGPNNPSSSPSQRGTFTFSVPPPPGVTFPSRGDASSPVAPEYSPITPKVRPVFPASVRLQDGARAAPPPLDTKTQTAAPTELIASAQYIPQPPPQPFSSEDSIDAIALRAAISALQFQKKQAHNDLRTLEATKRHALDHPQEFKDALVAGRLKEHRPGFGGLQAILDAAESDSEDEREDAVLGASAEDDMEDDEGIDADTVRTTVEIPDSQPSRPSTSSGKLPEASPPSGKPAEFPRIPGPQNVVRMPHINWEKYHIVGEPLDRMHEQQRRWPGNFAYGQDRGREFTVAAPYSPFLDVLDGQGSGSRKDSGAPTNAMASATGTVSEHPMETRRSSKNHQ
ncbi:hypothetical protein LTR08_001831 [Meristemomyces frigidus]|nr:hypothetical protein LTR08_001831 [Meristemomyces frigidus]